MMDQRTPYAEVTASRDVPHESATLHVTGGADYTDDLPIPEGALHAALGLATVAHGTIRRMDLNAVRAAPGVPAAPASVNAVAVTVCVPAVNAAHGA